MDPPDRSMQRSEGQPAGASAVSRINPTLPSQSLVFHQVEETKHGINK